MFVIACFHPNIGQRVKGSGTVPKIIRPYKGSGSSDDLEFRHLFLNGDVDSLGRELETFLVPCGKCVGCRLDYSREWADRCYLESLSKSPNWFVTLTYDDVNLPVTEFYDGENIIYTNSLVKSHISEFLKRLRRYYDYHFQLQDISFYGCGEYGSQFQRPHFHLLLFGCPIPDLELFTYKDGFATYNSDIFSKTWNKGFVTINEFTWETASYVARYCLKKQYGDNSIFYEANGLAPEFSIMSRSPGIGYKYFDEHKYEIFERGYIPVKKSNGVFHSPIPKYFERMLEKDDPLYFQQYKVEKRNKFFDSYVNDFQLSSSEVSILDQRDIDERAKLSQIKALRRQFESSFNIL
ncbi:MAG: hypothetical protein J6B80_02900 [Clostridia bacterium]|nr:hypothetical protein [Clostridia bacterium]